MTAAAGTLLDAENLSQTVAIDAYGGEGRRWQRLVGPQESVMFGTQPPPVSLGRNLLPCLTTLNT